MAALVVLLLGTEAWILPQGALEWPGRGVLGEIPSSLVVVKGGRDNVEADVESPRCASP